MKLLRLIALALGGLVVLVLVLVASLVISGWNTMHASETNPLPPLRVPPESALEGRGEHLVLTNCVGCHADHAQPPLAGGSRDFFDQPGTPPLGHLYAPNITPGGRLKDYTDAELARVIREGVNREGHPLVVMPSAQMRGLSDRDLSAIISYLRRQRPAAHTVPARQLTPLAYLMLGLHVIETSHQLPVTLPAPDMAEGMTVAYGGYLTAYLGCKDCHGADLHGGHKGQFPPVGPDLVALASAHDLGAFTLALRAGVSARDGHVLDPVGMPFPVYSRLTDTEVGAIYTYLQSLGKK